MIKRVALLRRRPDLTAEEFARHWREVHTKLALEMGGMTRYVINIVDRQQSPDAPIDGFSELWWRDLETMRAAFNTEAGRRLKADEANFTDGQVQVIVVEERTIKEEA